MFGFLDIGNTTISLPLDQLIVGKQMAALATELSGIDLHARK